MRKATALFLLLLLPQIPIHAQHSRHNLVYEGMSGYWTGSLEVRDSAGVAESSPVTCDIRRSLDAATLIIRTCSFDEQRISERFDACVFDTDSLVFSITRAGETGTERHAYTVQGLQRVLSPAQWVIRRTQRGGPPYLRSTDIRQNDSLIVLDEVSDDMVTWKVKRILRLQRRARPAVAEFILPGFASAQRVSVVGSFNGWQAGVTPMRRTRAGWSATLPLPPGEYQYKFSVDGRLERSPLSSSLIADGAGGYNAILVVQ
ncbi:MAG: isoamylase early set domain-containing protein [Bacteroidota bacterium]|nr:isoamylase early set domain-containing protein [Bacteroidota bacterium]